MIFLIRNHPRLFAPPRALLQRHKLNVSSPLIHSDPQEPILLRETTPEQISLSSMERTWIDIQNITKASERAQHENSKLFFSLFMSMTATVLLNVALFYQIITFIQSSDDTNKKLLEKEQDNSLCCHL